MSSLIYKIGLYSDRDSDFTLFTSIFEQITDLNITLRSKAPDSLIVTQKQFSEIPIYFISQNFFKDESFCQNLNEIHATKAPTLCILDDGSEETANEALNYAGDFWLFRDRLNPAIIKATLLKAEQFYRLKEQTNYLREKFHESEKRFLSVIRSKAEAVIVINKSGLIRFINPACEVQFDIKRENIGQMFPYKVALGQIREIDLKPLIGKPRLVEIIVNELVWENEKCMTISVHDKSEQKKVEDEMLTYRQVIRLSPLPILITNNDAYILYANEMFQKISGYSSEELIGKKPSLLKSSVHDEDFYKRIWNKLHSGEPWTGEICNRSKNGDLYWEKILISPVTNSKKEVIYFISIRVDDVELKRKEKAKRKEAALKSVQELAGGIAHEFSQPLQVLSISMALMEKDVGKSEYFIKANKMIRRIIELVDNLKSITTLRQQDYLSTKILDIRASSEQKIKDSKKNRILIIDDELELMESLQDILVLSGYDCEGVSNGPDALDLISKNPYRLIISDIDMPGMSGGELFKKIKQTDYAGYFVFMTGYEIDSDVEGLVKLADAFLIKPFQLSELKVLVDKIFNENKVEQ